MMPKRLVFVALSVVLLFSLMVLVCAAESFTVPPNQEIVRTVGLKEGDSVSGSVSASGGSGNDINFYITDPNGNTILRYDRTRQTSFSFSASITGTYTMHFDNSFSILSSKTISLDYSVGSAVLGIPVDTIILIVVLVVFCLIIAVLAYYFLRRSRTTMK